MRIKFVRDEVYETEAPGVGPHFEAGEVIVAREDFGTRWVRRGGAIELGAGAEDAALLGEERFVRLELSAADGVAAAAGEPEPKRPDRVERRGVLWFAMAGDARLGKGMNKASAAAYAAAHKLKAPA